MSNNQPMPRFFNRIRKQLAKDNKFFQYSRYAIGEILLVVVGILIALQINTWNENVSLNLEEQKALLNLKQDFEYNKQELDSLLISINRTIEGNLRILDFTGNKPRPRSEREFDSLMNFIAVTEQFFPRNGFLDDLLNSGKLGIFKNVELRNRLSLWKPIIEDISKSENSSLEFDYVLIDFVIKNGGWLNVDQVILSTLDVSFPKSGFDVDNRGLLEFIEFENMVENRIIFLNKLRSRLREAETLIAQILDLLNREIA